MEGTALIFLKSTIRMCKKNLPVPVDNNLFKVYSNRKLFFSHFKNIFVHKNDVCATKKNLQLVPRQGK